MPETNSNFEQRDLIIYYEIINRDLEDILSEYDWESKFMEAKLQYAFERSLERLLSKDRERWGTILLDHQKTSEIIDQVLKLFVDYLEGRNILQSDEQKFKFANALTDTLKDIYEDENRYLIQKSEKEKIEARDAAYKVISDWLDHNMRIGS